MKYCIVIPSYQAEEWIGAVVRGCLSHTRDVVVVDDGSSDHTREEALKAGAFTLRYEKHRGKGGALKTGFQHAFKKGFDAVVTLDADGQHCPEDIPAMLGACETLRCDLLIGSRARFFPDMISRRRLANLFARHAISLLSGTKLEDTQSGFRVYSACMLRAMHIKAEGYDAESEIIVKAGRGGYRIATCPISLSYANGAATSFYRPVADTAKIAVASVRSFVFSS